MGPGFRGEAWVPSKHAAVSDEPLTPTDIVDASAADLDDAMVLDVRAHRARDARYHLPPNALESVRERLHARGTIFLTAKAGGTTVGTAIASVAREYDGLGPRMEDVANVSFVAVDPAFWGRGIGRRLMEEIESRIRAAGFSRAQLWAREDDARSFTLYEHLGYRKTGESKLDHCNGDTIVRMAKDLL